MENIDFILLKELFASFPYGIIILKPGDSLLFLNDMAADILKVFKNIDERLLLNICEVKKWDEMQESRTTCFTRKIGSKVFLNNVFIFFSQELDEKLILITLIDMESIKGVDVFKSLKRINKELESIFESSYDGIILSDEEGKIYKVNKSVERLTGGIKSSDIMGKTSRRLGEEGFILSQTRKVLGKNPLMLIQKLRTGVEIFITSTRVFDDDGKVIFSVDNLRNIDELNLLRKQVEETVDLSQKYLTELQELRNYFMETDNIIAKSKVMKQVEDVLLRVSKTDATVLLTGESGVGKEIMARMIHKMSSRKSGPFIEINCAAIPENLLESELFGYKRGAFTGAQKEGKIGLMEMANKGTLLLDEIADLPLNLQVKLLRAIQEQVIYRLGDVVPIELDIRIIAATNRNLEQLVAEGSFRNDLYYRLNVVPIYIPPLRERREDIIPLVYHFLKKFNKRYSQDKMLDLGVCKVLENYDWPGNVRELENLIERLVITCEREKITREYLPHNFNFDYKLNGIDLNGITSLKDAAQKFEKDFLIKVMDRYDCKHQVARALQIDYSTLFRKLKKHALL